MGEGCLIRLLLGDALVCVGSGACSFQLNVAGRFLRVGHVGLLVTP